MIIFFLLLIVILMIITALRDRQVLTSDKVITVLARQSGRWSSAALQDENPLIANLHANYGAAYIFALRQIASDKDILRVTGKEAKRIEDEIVAVQDISAKKLINACPNIVPENKFLAALGGEGFRIS